MIEIVGNLYEQEGTSKVGASLGRDPGLVAGHGGGDGHHGV